MEITIKVPKYMLDRLKSLNASDGRKKEIIIQFLNEVMYDPYEQMHLDFDNWIEDSDFIDETEFK